VAKFTPWLVKPKGRTTEPTELEKKWIPGQVWEFWKREDYLVPTEI
jgi:hypothetical protein